MIQQPRFHSREYAPIFHKEIPFNDSLQGVHTCLLVSQIVALIFKRAQIGIVSLVYFLSFEAGLLVKKGVSQYTQPHNQVRDFDRKLLRWNDTHPYLIGTIAAISILSSSVLSRHSLIHVAIVGWTYGYTFSLLHHS